MKAPDVSERLRIAQEILEEKGVDFNGIEPEDVLRGSDEEDWKNPDTIKRLVGTAIYVSKRMVDGLSRVKAFKAAFPERCVMTDEKTGVYDAGRKLGDPLSDVTINVKAKRIETTDMYHRMVLAYQSSVYSMYAFDRIRVLDEALKISLDQSVSVRERDRYMKLFLDKTEKPETLKGVELNVNLTQNNVSVVQLEDKLDKIAHQLTDNMDAAGIIEAISKKNDTITVEDQQKGLTHA